jgi:hypothetical protein
MFGRIGEYEQVGEGRGRGEGVIEDGIRPEVNE